MKSLRYVLLVFLLLIFTMSGFLQAQDTRIDEAVEKFKTEIIEKRHHIHQYPELGNREFETAKMVAEHLRALGIEVTTGVAHTGVVGILKGGKPGPVVAVRADMDALPVTEDTPYPFRSTVMTTYLGKEVGVSHACGHDIHTSVALGVASVLASIRDEIPGTVKFIFQPAEEGPPPGEEGGADLMVQEKVLEDPRPSAIFGLHSSTEIEVGKIGFTKGAALAAVDHFNITVKGKQGHGASPHHTIDPIVMGAQAVMAFQTIRSRILNPLQPSVVTVGIFRGGERFNIISESAYMEGTVRTYDEATRDKIEESMNDILEGITQAYGGSFEMEYDRGTPPTINNEDLADRMLPTAVKVLGEEKVVKRDPTMGGEDFAYFANEVPGFFFWLGVLKPGTKSGTAHNPSFMADDSSIPVGMKVMSNLLLDFLISEGR
ncbi:M20 family metallopeptidase [candidate division KSB1 bacterium]